MEFEAWNYHGVLLKKFQEPYHVENEDVHPPGKNELGGLQLPVSLRPPDRCCNRFRAHWVIWGHW